jgi:hypothetical protein
MILNGYASCEIESQEVSPSRGVQPIVAWEWLNILYFFTPKWAYFSGMV